MTSLRKEPSARNAFTGFHKILNPNSAPYVFGSSRFTTFFHGFCSSLSVCFCVHLWLTCFDSNCCLVDTGKVLSIQICRMITYSA